MSISLLWRRFALNPCLIVTLVLFPLLLGGGPSLRAFSFSWRWRLRIYGLFHVWDLYLFLWWMEIISFSRFSFDICSKLWGANMTIFPHGFSLPSQTYGSFLDFFKWRLNLWSPLRKGLFLILINLRFLTLFSDSAVFLSVAVSLFIFILINFLRFLHLFFWGIFFACLTIRELLRYWFLRLIFLSMTSPACLLSNNSSFFGRLVRWKWWIRLLLFNIYWVLLIMNLFLMIQILSFISDSLFYRNFFSLPPFIFGVISWLIFWLRCVVNWLNLIFRGVQTDWIFNSRLV